MNFVTIAIAYRSATAATTICMLEAAGFDVFCPGFQIANTLPHYAWAIGGIQINVPADQAQDALDLLLSYPGATPEPASPVSRALNGAGWLAFGISSPWPDLLVRDKAASAA